MAFNPAAALPHPLAALTLLAMAFSLSHWDALGRYVQQRYHANLPGFTADAEAPTTISAFAELNQQWHRRGVLVSQALFGASPQPLAIPEAAAASEAPAPLAQTCETPNAPAPETSQEGPEAKQPPPAPPTAAALSGKKILLAGDSMMQGVAPHLQVALRKGFKLPSTDLSKQSTGLLYTAGFNWPQTLETAFATGEYQTAVILLGANDTWDLQQKGKSLAFGSEDWKTAYGSRVRSILESAQSHQVKVVWLAAPPMGREPLTTRIETLNQAIAEQVAQFPQLAQFIATAPSLTQNGVAFTPFITLPNQGEVRVRTQDGVHFTPQGQKILAQLTLSHLQPQPIAAPEVNHAP